MAISNLAHVMSCITASLLPVAFAGGLAQAQPLLTSQPPCTLSAGACLYFTQAGIAFSARTLDFDAPVAGSALVSVLGSGYCRNNGSSVEVAQFETQIVNKPSAVPNY